MTQLRWAGLALALAAVFAVGTPARADDADARAILDKAIKAHGGEETLTKLAANTTSMTGKIHAMGMEIPFTGDVLALGRDRMKLDLQIDVGGQKLRIVNVFLGNKGWTRIDKEVRELTKDEIEEGLEQAHAGWATTLVPIKADKKFTVSSLGEAEVEKKKAVGIKVSYKGFRDIDMYFDKATGLLVKRENRAKDDSGQEVNEETFFSNYKEVQGTQQPMKFLVKRDGKPFVEAEVTNVVLSEKFDANAFEKP